MLSKKLQEEIRRQASPSPHTWLWHRNRSCPFRRQLPNDINRKCRPQTFAHARHARPRPLDPHPSLVLLFVSSSPSSSQRLGPAPSLSDLTATVCMHARTRLYCTSPAPSLLPPLSRLTCIWVTLSRALLPPSPWWPCARAHICVFYCCGCFNASPNPELKVTFPTC